MRPRLPPPALSTPASSLGDDSKPAVANTPVELSRQSATSSPINESAAFRPLRILLAEDNLVNQKLVLKLLERQGHMVMIARNGKEAVALFNTQSFDLLLMDVQMPEMDGMEATAVIRAKESAYGFRYTSRIPIIALTAYAMKGDAERCLAAGMDGYLAKPINIAELNDAINFFTRTPSTISPE
jgi:CheY-like chemotaxis protein